MKAATYIRGALIVFILGSALILGLAGAFAGSMRERLVFAPHERDTEGAVRQLVEREKALRAAKGNFVAFSNADVEKNASLLGLAWSTFPVKEYFFDAIALESGNIRLRALPRADCVASLSIRARLYIAELSPAGEIVHSGWYPSTD
ncbi:MAG TPA: hypothetical protein VGM72_09895 [Micropepsaceae bacterium]|jgi:hypothetical protein